MIRAHLSSSSRRRVFGRIMPWVILGLSGAILIQPGCAPSKPEFVPTPREVTWFGLHVLVENKKDARMLLAEIPHLAELGINLLIAEVDYNYEYVSHPELRGPDPVSCDWAPARSVPPCRPPSPGGATSQPSSSPASAAWAPAARWSSHPSKPRRWLPWRRLRPL